MPVVAFSPTYLLHDVSDPLGPLVCVLSLAPYAMGLALGVWYLATRSPRCVAIGVAVLVSEAINYALKNAIRQPRPNSAAADSRVDYGMPSRHAQFCAAMAWGVITHGTRTKLGPSLVCGLAVGCAYSRVHLGYHTPEQVIVGLFVGAVTSRFVLEGLNTRPGRAAIKLVNKTANAVANLLC
eukprot:Hpha_TRINITY_DN29180_c0_g1::TRINITY_DN29180_c0_g1_i1::g.195366::m.195366/K07252/E3.6.1.43; dolichyldiphosphatase